MKQAVIAAKSTCDSAAPPPNPHWREPREVPALRLSQCFSSEPAAAPAVRRFVSAALGQWGYTQATDDLLLCACELATNAQIHGTDEGEQFLVSVMCLERPGSFRVEVHDRSLNFPLAGPVTPDDEDGRGLLLVSALSSRWGVEPRSGGKVVWSELQIPLPTRASTC
ncbi:ATP-binding protein [Streptomyces sp. NPDC001205]